MRALAPVIEVACDHQRRVGRVTAVDSSEASAELMRDRADPGHAKQLAIQTQSIQDATFPNVDLVYSGYSLPFVPPVAFPPTWARIRAAC